MFIVSEIYKSKKIFKTLWPGSKCTDVSSLSIDGSQIASSHFNKQIHFNDTRGTKDNKRVVTLGGRITGLASPSDFSPLLLAVTRDNEINVIDIRQMVTRIKLTDQEYRVGADYSRCSFSVSDFVIIGLFGEGIFAVRIF
jgi:WD40 repeat protein